MFPFGQLVLFLDGLRARLHVHLWTGACLTGDPTAYVYRDQRLVWVKRGESVSWIECS